MREEMPTLVYDLSEFARIHTGPFSWSDETPIEDESFDDMVSGPFIGVRRSDIPRVAISLENYDGPALDHRESFVLALLDGCSTVERLVDAAGLPEAETLAALCELCARGVIAFEGVLA
jgi:hypothetical protein